MLARSRTQALVDSAQSLYFEARIRSKIVVRLFASRAYSGSSVLAACRRFPTTSPYGSVLGGFPNCQTQSSALASAWLHPVVAWLECANRFSTPAD